MQTTASYKWRKTAFREWSCEGTEWTVHQIDSTARGKVVYVVKFAGAFQKHAMGMYLSFPKLAAAKKFVVAKLNATKG